MPARGWVLYEDQRDDDVKEFGLHRLVVCCVADQVGALDWWHVRELIEGSPKKSSSKVRQACQRDLGRLTASGGYVVAVYDADRAHELTPPLRKGACKRQICDALAQGCLPHDRLAVTLLVQNTETLLESIQRLRPSLVSAEMFVQALRHKRSRAARDQVFIKASAEQGLRQHLQTENPSFGRVVREVARIYRLLTGGT
jgi:hypothetical protein